MLKQFRKHYMSILTLTIFISVFLYQFLNLIKIPIISQYSLVEINYLYLLIYTILISSVVSIIYNVMLFATIEITLSFSTSNISIKAPYREISYDYISKIIISKRYKTYSVFRC
jgi:hypothetical protein